MTDDYAIEGEDAGYVPCREGIAALVVEEEGAISGQAAGRVPEGAEAANSPAPEREAIVGSGAGYVPGPCGCPPTFFDDFAREVTIPIEQTQSVSLASGPRSARLVKRERSTVSAASLPAPAPTLLAYWTTNGFITNPADDTTAMSGPGMSALNGPPFDDMHYDVEERRFIAPGAFGNWPANCTSARFWRSGGLPRWGHHPTWTPLPLHETTLQVYSGFWQGGSTGWDDGALVASVVIPADTDYVDEEVQWVPAEGMPDFMLKVASADELSPFATGTKYVNDDDTINFDNLRSLQARYPDDKSGLYVFPPGGGNVYAQNDATDVVEALSPVPSLEVTFPGPPGWGTGPEVDWNQWGASGDDWSDSVAVSDGMGILRTHLSSKTTDSSDAWVYHDEELHRDFDDLIRVKFSNVIGPVTPYTDGVHAQIGPESARLVVYPDSDRIDFGPNLDIAGGGMDWTDWVIFRIQEDATSSRVKWWQEGDAEPGAWMEESIGGGWHLVGGDWDRYYFDLVADAPYSRDLTLYITCIEE